MTDPYELIPPGEYVARVIDYEVKKSTITDRDLVGVTCRLLDADFDGRIVYGWFLLDSPKADWKWDSAFTDLDRETVIHQERMIAISQEEWDGRTRNLVGKFTQIPDYPWRIDMEISAYAGPPDIGASNEVVSTAMDEAVAAAKAALRRRGLVVARTGYGYRPDPE